MAEIKFTIPDDKIQRVIDAMKGLYPIPQIPNPNYGEPNEPDRINEFTDAQWAKESVRRFIKRSVARYENRVAVDAIEYQEDDDIAS